MPDVVNAHARHFTSARPSQTDGQTDRQTLWQ